MEKPLYPSPYMRITQGYMEGSHQDSYAIDDAGSDSGIDFIRCPFTGIVKKIYPQDANEVWIQSVDTVEYPDGTIDYMTMMFAHDNDVSNLSVGQVIPRGERFYEEGTKGNATGNHVHMECGRGKFEQDGWHVNRSGYWSINNGKNPTECLWIDDSITILDSHGYSFKSIPVDTPVKPKEELGENTTSSNPTSSSQNKEKLIFTASKDDIYAIYLKKGDKLYLE